MGPPIDKITLKGFKSIRSLEDFPLRSLNILIGANGAGKSNFVDFFRLLRAMAGGSLQSFVLKYGEPTPFYSWVPNTRHAYQHVSSSVSIPTSSPWRRQARLSS